MGWLLLEPDLRHCFLRFAMVTCQLVSGGSMYVCMHVRSGHSLARQGMRTDIFTV